MAGAFIDEHPPRLPMLDRYGDELPRFLAQFSPAADVPYLPDLAQIEGEIALERS